jgi:isoamyl acetate esterase
MPRILIIGDSISIGYTPLVTADLAGKALIEHNPGNGADSANVLAHLDEWTAGHWDLIHLNCGLHDLKRPKGTLQVINTLEQYEANLRQIFRRLTSRPPTKIIWVTTTPVVDERHPANKKDIDRSQSDVRAYNAVAARVLQNFPIPVTDLHALVLAHGPEQLILNDGVHYGPTGYRLLADTVTANIRQVLAL